MPNLKTQAEIRDQILRDMAAGGLTASGSGTTNRIVAEAMSRALADGHYLLGLLLDAFFLERAEGEFLDLRVKDRLPDGRKPGTQATGRLTFSRSSPAIAQITVPAGTTVVTPDGTVELVTMEAGTIRAGDTYVTVPARAAAVGVDGNLPAGTSLRIKGLGVQGIESVTVAMPGFTGGTDRETDAQLRERYLFELRNPRRSGSVADYKAWAMAVNGVTNATVIPLARGPGTVDVLITTGGGIPDQDLVDAVQDAIDAVKPAVDDVWVLAPAVLAVDVQVALTPAAGYTVGGLAPAVRQAIRNYIAGLGVGEPVFLAGVIVAAMRVPGVANCVVTEPRGDVAVGPVEKALPGIIEVQEPAALPNLFNYAKAYDITGEWTKRRLTSTPVPWPAPFEEHGGHRITVVDDSQRAQIDETADVELIPSRTYRFSVHVRGTVGPNWYLMLTTDGSDWPNYYRQILIPPGTYEHPTRFTVEYTYPTTIPTGARPFCAVLCDPPQLGATFELGYMHLALLP